MTPLAAGDLVKVTIAGTHVVDGIVFDVTGAPKIVVALVDRERGPGMRTVDAEALSERAEAGADDRALQMLIRRTPQGVRGAARGGAGGGGARSGHKRASMHRTTGK
jgi:hypothetical protein